MNTLRLPIDPHDLNSDDSQAAIEQAASILRARGLVAFPTETVYGLGANAMNSEAVAKIFHAKQRPGWDPVIVHISDLAMLAMVAAMQNLGSCARDLMKAHWPGPLTLLLPKADAVPAVVTAGRTLVGVRMPAHPVAQALIAAAGFPIAAPSANSFGRISPTTAAHVLEDLDGRIDAILDSGETAHGLESTVVDASTEPVVIYRPGVVPLQEIRDICGSATIWIPPGSANTNEMPPESMPSPGVGIRHYAPRARLILISGAPADQATAFAEAVKQATGERIRVGLLLPRNFIASTLTELASDAVVFDWGDWENLPELAHRLFAGLRQLDAHGVELILCPLPGGTGIGAALQDRLIKAAKAD
jgi:L-threonylcarbamoyladenylate synthase